MSEIVKGIIADLSDPEYNLLLEELEKIDKKLRKKVQFVVDKTGLSLRESLEYIINDDIVLWAKVHLNWEARGYQKTILRETRKSKKTVLRLGRRLGKTECMIVSILWHAFRQPNKRDVESAQAYEILILTPFETQIDLIFDRMKQLIDSSPTVSSMVSRTISHRYEFTNGAIIKGLTVGSSSGKGASNTRGQAASLLILDECDYMGSMEITNILNIANEDPSRIKIITASTPSGKHEEFYQWCVGASRQLYVSEEDIKNYTFSGFLEKTQEKGNGWTSLWAPSLVNKTILDINPDTGQTYLEDIKDELTSIRFEQEVFAMFGDMEFGVYKKDLLDAAYAFGDRVRTKYWEDYTPEEKATFKVNRAGKILVAAVDFDIAQACPNILCVMYDKTKQEKYFEVLFRIDIPRTEFLLTSAVNKLIELNDEFNFDHIALDRGLGEQAVEMVKQYGQLNPQTGLHVKTVGYHFGSSLEVYDPVTLKKVKKDFKPFLVDNSVLVFERGRMVLNEKDKVLKRQLNAYKIEKVSANGRPIFSSTDEHSVDTLNMCLLQFQISYGSLFKLMIKGAFGSVNLNKKVEEDWNNREIEKKVVNGNLSDKYEFLVTRKEKKPSRRKMGNFKRTGW